MEAQAPIGIFDSGIGGLTVAKAIRQALPKERLVYFGDTAHLPYGEKSTAAIQAYSVKICDVLLRQGVKVIVIACNSASASAFELVREYVGSHAMVLDVVHPVVEQVGEAFAGQKVGLIGTRRTIESNLYKKALDRLGVGVQLQSLATPLLAPMIEEGFCNNNLSRQIIANYLQDAHLQGIRGLILGCTHYPLIEKQIAEYYQGEVAVIDSARVVAQQLKDQLAQQQLLAQRPAEEESHFFVSDYTHSFETSTRLFFGQSVTLAKYPLWE